MERDGERDDSGVKVKTPRQRGPLMILNPAREPAAPSPAKLVQEPQPRSKPELRFVDQKYSDSQSYMDS